MSDANPNALRKSRVSADSLVGVYGHQLVNKAVSFDLYSGQLGILVGGNGAGKTTALEGLLGIRATQSKGLSILGDRPPSNRLWRLVRAGVRYVPQSTTLPPFLAIDELVDAWRLNAEPKLKALRRLDRSRAAAMAGASRDSLIGELSYGQRRALEVALAVGAGPLLLFADEPLAGLDSDRLIPIVESVTEFVAAGGAALVVAHEPELEHWKPDWIVRLEATDG